jgi:hypothetical protein
MTNMGRLLLLLRTIFCGAKIRVGAPNINRAYNLFCGAMYGLREGKKTKRKSSLRAVHEARRGGSPADFHVPNSTLPSSCPPRVVQPAARLGLRPAQRP